ncbi:MAG: TonB-dependent receptor [Bacteroidales bacterium]|nr:TonB-dependent receptor [Bacteroidales bacterium]MDY0140996.1 TonB-dependent receptor [Bacteroidales bacterium]
MKYILLAFFVFVGVQMNAQKQTDAHIIGHVECCGEHIPFVNIMIKNTTIGTSTDETGHFQLINMPEGDYILIAHALGYKSSEEEVTIVRGKTIEIKFELLQDVMGLEEVVITGDRNEKNRKESAVVVNTLTPKTLESNNSVTISEGLNFCSGLRVENNCQNCGFNQLRMNGMEGPYSQVLINSRAIFSGLAGVYGLELIPANMIERVEIVRGGGSALYGSNAIAGTVNMILKDPITNSYEFGTNTGFVGTGINNSGKPALDLSVNLNASLISSDSKTGMSVYGFHRDKEPFDANNDGFSEQSAAQNTTIGTRIFHRFSTRSKITLDYFNINEERRGGSDFEKPYHVTALTEAVEHSINTAAINYDLFVREQDQIAVFASAQHILRDSYYGANYSLSDYGKTKDLSYSVGAQYTMRQGKSNLVAGIESTGSFLNDQKPSYADYGNAVIEDGEIVHVPFTQSTIIANQRLVTSGTFAQYERKLNRFRVSLGARFDNYVVTNLEDANQKKDGQVFSPRANVLFDITEYLQLRVNYSQGFRAPQVFDEDLHIETSGSRQVIHRNDPNLHQETSHSVSSSLDFKKNFGKINISFLTEGFYTILNNPFVNEYGVPDEYGVVVYTRVNADEGAIVKGINFELSVFPGTQIVLRSGFTLQQSVYEEVQEFDEKRFFRTPDNYGFFTLDYNPIKDFTASATGTYTGEMLVPYFGTTLLNPEIGELRVSETFFDLGFKAQYNIKLNGAKLQIFAGIKNIFNSYQKDFDSGIDRDPAYIYGPMSPRTVYFGIKIGNMLG